MAKQSARRDVPNKILLSEREVPKTWYNVMADMPNKMAPPLNPGTREPLKPEDLTGRNQAW
jgi:tryptophan synthase beta chain